MICLQYYAEYLDYVYECGDCKVPMIDACLINLPIPEMTWKSLPPFQGKVYADMAVEILDDNNIPNYLKMDWASSALNIEGANLIGREVLIFVPETSMEKAFNLVSSIIGESN